MFYHPLKSTFKCFCLQCTFHPHLLWYLFASIFHVCVFWSPFCLCGALEQPRVITMALCSQPCVPNRGCGFLLMLRAASLELQMPAECDRVVFVLFVSSIWPVLDSVWSLDSGSFVDEISWRVSPPPWHFLHQMKSEFAFQSLNHRRVRHKSLRVGAWNQI